MSGKHETAGVGCSCFFIRVIVGGHEMPTMRLILFILLMVVYQSGNPQREETFANGSHKTAKF